LENGAESSANAFCDSIAIGSVYSEGESRARKSGEDKLRIISNNSFTVGFTGILPFSRHLCEVTRDGELVNDKHYFHLG